MCLMSVQGEGAVSVPLPFCLFLPAEGDNYAG